MTAIWAALAVLLVLSVLAWLYQDQILEWIVDARASILQTKGSWALAILLMTLIGLPPLTGQTIVLMIFGIVWGLAQGSLMGIAGHLAGETIKFVAFRYFFAAKAERLEQQHRRYEELSQLLRQGGVMNNVLLRLSFISGHVVAALQAVSGVSIWVYWLTVSVLSLRREHRI